MIRPFRERHRQVFTILAVILPAAFAIGVAARRPVSAIEPLPAVLRPEPFTSPTMIWSRDDLFAKTRVRVALLREQGKTGALAVRLFARAAFVKPDLLVYWSASEVKDKLPHDAALLGAFSGSVPLRLPSEHSATGSLILYSLADGEVVEVSKPVAIP